MEIVEFKENDIDLVFKIRRAAYKPLYEKYHDDDDNIEFASNFGYSVRPSERGKGYAKEQLRIGLQKAKARGLDKVRIVCRDINIGSNKTILANGGVYVDMIHGEKLGMNINRYDIQIS